MNISYNLIKKLTNESIEISKLKKLINNSVIEVENVQKLINCEDLVVGKVISASKHPNSKKLIITKVDVGLSKPLQILCGAPNVKENQIVVVALPNSQLNDFKIESRIIAGEQSNGMICGLEEILNIDPAKIKDEHKKGIIELPSNYKVGTKIIETPLYDTMFEIGLTPNRNDLLSKIGQRNDLATLFNRRYQIPTLKTPTIKHTEITTKIETPKAKALTIHEFTNIDLKADLLKEIELLKYNVRSIDPIVDFSNEVMLETGQPIHFYDKDKIVGTDITVRMAKNGEQIELLNGQIYTLSEQDIVICDEAGPISLAGVMGTNRTKCDEKTKNILVEIADFDPISVRKTALKTNNRSESSIRFEKGISVHHYEASLQYIFDNLKATYIGSSITEMRQKTNLKITFKINQLIQYIGHSIDLKRVEEILTNLNYCPVINEEKWQVEIPNIFTNIETREDVFEEIIRFYGLNNVNLTNEINHEHGLNNLQKMTRKIEDYLVMNGLNEVISYNLVKSEKSDFNHLDVKIEPIKLMHPQSQVRTTLKTNNVESILEIITYNNNRQENNLKLFEISKRYGKNLNDKFEQNILTIALQNYFNNSYLNKEMTNFYTIKGLVESILNQIIKIDMQKVSFKQTDKIKGMHPYQTVEIWNENTYLGYFGKVNKANFKNVFVAEIILDNLIITTNELIPQYKQISKFPITRRMITVVTKKDINQADIVKQIKANQEALISIELVDIYDQNDSIASTYELSYQQLNSEITQEIMLKNEQTTKSNILNAGWELK